MRVLRAAADPNMPARTLAILLPGALQQPEEFVQAGFVDAVRKRGLPIDLAMVDLGLQYIGETTNGRGLQRLHTIVEEHSRQYQTIWLAGISIGGFMAMAYAHAYPGRISGLCLLAPYPGNRMLTGEIRKAQGLAHWNAQCAPDDGECQVWQWLQSGAARDLAQCYFGYGLQDRFAAGQQLMSTAFAKETVDVIAGAHDWPAWQQLWNNFLDRVTALAVHNPIPCK
jgi:pimeloyl-ACP methyl ester carboxylesterase